MKEVYDIDHIAKDLALRANLPKEIVQVVLHRLFTHIVIYLESGNEVYVKGLGTFSLGNDASGRRYRLQFDETFKSSLNEPFSCFEPVVLNPGREEMKEIDKAHDVAEEEKAIEEPVISQSSICIGELLTSEVPSSVKKLQLRRRKRAIRVNWACFVFFFFLGIVGLYYVLVDSIVDLLPEVVKIEEINLRESIVEPSPKIDVDTVYAITKAMPIETTKKMEQVVEIKENVLPKLVTLRAGERLALLAQRYYGSEFFWVYIFEYNKNRYQNPNLIPEGAVLKLPSKAHYAINADDPASIGRAKELMRQIAP